MNLYFLCICYFFSAMSGYCINNTFEKALLDETGRISKLQSLSFQVSIKTKALATFNGAKQGDSQQTKFCYSAQRGSNKDLLNFFKYRLELLDTNLKYVVNTEVTYNQTTFSAFDHTSRYLAVDSVVLQPYNLLRDKAGIFLPIRFLAPLSGGKPAKLDGFIFCLTHLEDQNILSTLTVFSSPETESLAKLFFKDQESFAIKTENLLSKPKELVDSYYIIVLTEDKQIESWLYVENGKPFELFKIKERFTTTSLKGFMSKSEMTYLYNGEALSKSDITIDKLDLNKTMPEDWFEIDPSLANSIYDRNAKKLITVPK